jgi:multidrug efflux pump subunit AcrA (membrane-fusion protein)
MKFKVLALLFVLLLSGCSVISPAAPTPLPTVVLGEQNPALSASGSNRPAASSGSVTASGNVVPSQEAKLAFMLSGSLKTLEVAEGDPVQAGQELARLQGQEDLDSAVSAAQLELEQIAQSLKDLNTQAATSRVKAMQDITTYEQAVRDAQYALDNFTVPLDQAGLDAVEGLKQSKLRLDAARTAFEPYKYLPSGDKTRKDQKELLDQAQADYNAAVRRLQYEYDLEVAQNQLDKAQQDYEMYKAGPDPDQVRLLEARRANAQTKLAAAQADIAHLILTSPFSGTVSQVDFNPGEWVVAGQPVLTLADVHNLRVETSDLSERDIPRVTVGAPVTVFVKALNQQIQGRVSKISPLADTLGGDVVYKVTVELIDPPPGLRAGMSVDVQL